MTDESGPSKMSSSFYVTDIGELQEEDLKTILKADRVVTTTWELNESQHRYAEAFFHNAVDAGKTYGLEVQGEALRTCQKRSNSVLWVSGLPGVVCARDLFTSLQELTPGLLSVCLPRNPE